MSLLLCATLYFCAACDFAVVRASAAPTPDSCGAEDEECLDDAFATIQIKQSVNVVNDRGSGPCTTYSPGMHLVQLPDLKRQFLLFVPRELVQRPTGVPLVMTFHGHSDNPWYINQFGGFSVLLERYGWLGMFPFGLNAIGDNGLGGVTACCPAKDRNGTDCDEDCCRNGKEIVGLWGNQTLACEWSQLETLGLPSGNHDGEFVEALVKWAEDNTCTDTNTIFATGFSNGGMFTNHLACAKSHLFKVFAPISGDALIPFCTPSRPITYISMCGSGDYISHCDKTVLHTAKGWKNRLNCTGGGEDGKVTNVSASSHCTRWDDCEDGNFVEACMTDGLPHDVSGHLSPARFSTLRPGSDLDFPEYVFQKFSLFAGDSILFSGHPNSTELTTAEEMFHNGTAPEYYFDHTYLRDGRLLGKDYTAPEEQ